MDNNITTYQFWLWTPKLNGVLAMLSELAKYELTQSDLDAISIGLVDTCDEKNNWFDYKFDGEKYSIMLRLAFDKEEGKDMTHIKIQTSIELEQKLQALDLFQSLFRQLDVES